jgi:hypothetical protein
MLVAVQGRNDLAVIDPAGMTVERRVELPGCDHPHGLAGPMAHMWSPSMQPRTGVITRYLPASTGTQHC